MEDGGFQVVSRRRRGRPRPPPRPGASASAGFRYKPAPGSPAPSPSVVLTQRVDEALAELRASAFWAELLATLRDRLRLPLASIICLGISTLVA